MKTLIVTYLPSGTRSNTQKLLDLYKKEIGGEAYETLDLLKTQIPFFTEESMAAYGKRNYMGQALSTSEAQSLAKQDELTAQFKSADVIVFAHPMHNFGMPGLVKTYLDAVMLNGVTFEMGKKLMAGKKALTLYTAGGVYPQHQVSLDYPHWDALSLMTKINFSFMGFDETEVIGTSLRDPATAEINLADAQTRIQKLTNRWYK